MSVPAGGGQVRYAFGAFEENPGTLDKAEGAP